MALREFSLAFTPTQFQNLQTIRNQNLQQNKIIKTKFKIQK